MSASIRPEQSDKKKVVEIKKTLSLLAPLVFLYNPGAPGCIDNSCDELWRVKDYREPAENFIQKTFPLPNNGFSLRHPNLSNLLDIAIKGTPRDITDSLISRTESCRDNNGDLVSIEIYKSFHSDIVKLMKVKNALPDNPKRLSVAVPAGYFAYHNFPDSVLGLQVPGYPIAFVEYEKDTFSGATLAQEIAHTFGLEDSYNQSKVLFDPVINTCRIGPGDADRGPRVDGFDVYAEETNTLAGINNARDFMGAGGADKYWVSQDNWLQLSSALSKDGVDPQLALVQFSTKKNGEYRLYDWLVFDGIDRGIPNSGTYTLQVIDILGNISSQFNFEPNYEMHFGFIAGESDTALVSLHVPFSVTDRYIVVKDDNGNELFKVDAIIKASNDSLPDLPTECLINGSDDKDQVNTLLSNIKKLSDSNDLRNAMTNADLLNNLLINNTLDGCHYLKGFLPTKEAFLSISQKLLESFSARVDAIVLVGDFDNDGDVDRDDLNILMASRNQPARDADDPMDLDGDGMITGLDARKLTQLCTRPRCAIE